MDNFVRLPNGVRMPIFGLGKFLCVCHSPLYQPRKMCIMHAWLSHFDLASETLTGKISASVNHSLKSIAYLLIFSRHTWVPYPPSCPLYLQSRLGLLRLIPRVGTRRNTDPGKNIFFEEEKDKIISYLISLFYSCLSFLFTARYFPRRRIRSGIRHLCTAWMQLSTDWYGTTLRLRTSNRQSYQGIR